MTELKTDSGRDFLAKYENLKELSIVIEDYGVGFNQFRDTGNTVLELHEAVH